MNNYFLKFSALSLAGALSLMDVANADGLFSVKNENVPQSITAPPGNVRIPLTRTIEFVGTPGTKSFNLPDIGETSSFNLPDGRYSRITATMSGAEGGHNVHARQSCTPGKMLTVDKDTTYLVNVTFQWDKGTKTGGISCHVSPLVK